MNWHAAKATAVINVLFPTDTALGQMDQMML